MAEPLKSTPYSSGFTLIELAIVLVIIGLIIGGVLVGRDLIEAAKLQRQYAEITKMNEAVLTFKLKYNCLPGDCVNARQFFNAGAQPDRVTNGNGDGVIYGGERTNGGYYSAPNYEWGSVFDQLAAAGLVSLKQYDETDATTNRAGYAYPQCTSTGPSGSSLSAPSSVVGDGDCGVMVAWESSGHFFRIGATPSGSLGYGFMNFYAGWTPFGAKNFDVKFDDGNAISGRIQLGYFVHQDGWAGLGAQWDGQNLATHPVYGAVGGSVHYCSDTAGVYLTHEYKSCSLRIKANF